MYLPCFAEDSDITATFAVQEATPAFNPYVLKQKLLLKMINIL